MVLALLFFVVAVWLVLAGRSAAEENGTQGNLPSQGRGRELWGTQEEAELSIVNRQLSIVNEEGNSAELSGTRVAGLQGMTPTPTVDRLAAPPTVENPNQADEGAQLYWLHCLPCHGDRGQGLTDEWRAQYPPEDQNCWESGCHGNRPYEAGFVLPTAVPPLVGEDSLQRFDTWGEVYQFMQVSMPYQAAGSLTEAEYLAIVAFLARAHERWDGTLFDASNVGAHGVRPAVATATATVLPVTNEPAAPPAGSSLALPVAFLLIALVAAVGAVLWWGWLRPKND